MFFANNKYVENPKTKKLRTAERKRLHQLLTVLLLPMVKKCVQLLGGSMTILEVRHFYSSIVQLFVLYDLFLIILLESTWTMSWT